ncbi:unnamed protein product [Closterium sp. Yama58-4]|nr:unnamed protein product [Closterium sp. Yama58-4]
MVGARITITDNQQAVNSQDFSEQSTVSAGGSNDLPTPESLQHPQLLPPPLPPPSKLSGGARRGYVPVRRQNPAATSSDDLPSSRLSPRPSIPPPPLPPPLTLSGGPRRGYVPARRRTPSGAPPLSIQIRPSDGTHRRQLRGRSNRQAEEDYGDAGEAGVTPGEAGETSGEDLKSGVVTGEDGRFETSPELYYNGGAVIADPVVYLIYYGTWPANSGAAVIENFVQSLGGNASRQGGARGESSVSDWWAITTHYYMTRADRTRTYVTPKVGDLWLYIIRPMPPPDICDTFPHSPLSSPDEFRVDAEVT